jgi:predicted Zn-dependent protease
MKPSPHPVGAWLAAWRRSESRDSWHSLISYLRWPVLIVLGALIAEKLLYYGAFPLQDYAAREWDRASARIEFARGHDQVALLSIRAALLRTRDDPSSWKLAAEISEHLDSPETAYCWQQLDRLRPGATATELSLARAALRSGQADLAAQALTEVSPDDQGQMSFLLLAGKLAEVLGQKAQARRDFARVEAAHPADSATLLALAEGRIDGGTPADLQAARGELMALVIRPGAALPAQRLLIRTAMMAGDFPGAKKWSDGLLASGSAAMSDRVQRLDILQELSPPACEAELNRLMTTSGPAEIVPVAAWMIGHARAEAALIWIRRQPEEIQDDPAIGIARAEALSALGLWEHLRDDQANDTWPGHEPERLMYLARACVELRAQSDGRAAWQAAVLACEDERDCLALLNYLARVKPEGGVWDWREEARAEVWTRLLAQYPDRPWAVRALIGYETARNDSAVVEHLDAELAGLEPVNPQAAANYARVCLLRGSRVEQASASLRSLFAENPADPAVATAEASDLYRQGRFGAALAALGGLSPEELHAPSQAVYLGALLAVDGPAEPARAALAVALSRPDLLSEERVLVERSRDLLDYRVALGRVLHGGDENPAWRGAATASSALALVVESVAATRSGTLAEAARELGRIDTASLDPAGLTIYVGGVLELAGPPALATPYLELSPDLPFETAAAKCHHAVEAWWSLRAREPDDPDFLDGLFAAYRGLDAHETDPAFWRGDQARELQAVRMALLREPDPGAAEDRLHRLMRHVPCTPEIAAQLAYALFLHGQARAARTSLEALAPGELTQPEPSLFYGVILAACGEKREGRICLQRALGRGLMPEEQALALKTQREMERTP